MDSFHIDFDWLPRDHGNPLERATFAELAIHVNEHIATRVDDILAKTVRDHVRGSAYVLASWLAANWWRLRHEPESRSLSWKLSHELGAAGKGYMWPSLAFTSDGSSILVQCRPTGGGRGETIRFINSFDTYMQVGTFERGVDDFIEAVVARLHGSGHGQEELSSLWAEIRAEREDATLAAWRRLEALLGYDPDEAPEGLIKNLQEKESALGHDAVGEIASAARSKAIDHLNVLAGPARSKAKPARVPGRGDLHLWMDQATDPWQPPWRLAEKTAQKARVLWELDKGPIPNTKLAALFCMDESVFVDSGEMPAVPMAAGYRIDRGEEEIEVFLNKHIPSRRRFALARLVADHLNAGLEDCLLPATDAKRPARSFSEPSHTSSCVHSKSW